MLRLLIKQFTVLVLGLYLLVIPSLVLSDNPAQGAVVTAHPLATQAGIDILQQGGNAFDAAVAITAALGVVEPFGSGLGGGGFWLLHFADNGRTLMLDGREQAPALATRDYYLDAHKKVREGASINGAGAAAIPGVPAALDHIASQYGEFPLATSLAGAIQFAEQGFAVTERYQKLAGFRIEQLKQSAAGVVFLQDNKIPDIGYMIVQRDLANTLKKIAQQGSNVFYRGQLATKMVEAVRTAGGIWSGKDLEDYRIRLRAPMVFDYHGIKIFSASPPSSGGIVLAQALGILSHFDLTAYNDITRKHIVIETMRRAYRDRAVYLGDPDYVSIPTVKLLNRDYLEGLAQTIDPEQATPSHILGDTPDIAGTGSHTTHFSVLDKAGNRVAATLSINLPFGSGFLVPGTGILLNNEMDDFSIKANHPNAYGLVGDEANAVAPGKRPLSSMSPTFLETPDRVAILGTPGGSRIISMVLLAILEFVDGTKPETWVRLPRYHHQYLPDEVQFEQDGLTLVERNGLKALGHMLVEKNRQYGNMQAILWDRQRNRVYAASDPRGEGTAQILY